MTNDGARRRPTRRQLLIGFAFTLAAIAFGDGIYDLGRYVLWRHRAGPPLITAFAIATPSWLLGWMWLENRELDREQRQQVGVERRPADQQEPDRESATPKQQPKPEQIKRALKKQAGLVLLFQAAAGLVGIVVGVASGSVAVGFWTFFVVGMAIPPIAVTTRTAYQKRKGIPVDGSRDG